MIKELNNFLNFFFPMSDIKIKDFEIEISREYKINIKFKEYELAEILIDNKRLYFGRIKYISEFLFSPYLRKFLYYQTMFSNYDEIENSFVNVFSGTKVFSDSNLKPVKLYCCFGSIEDRIKIVEEHYGIEIMNNLKEYTDKFLYSLIYPLFLITNYEDISKQILKYLFHNEVYLNMSIFNFFNIKELKYICENSSYLCKIGCFDDNLTAKDLVIVLRKLNIFAVSFLSPATFYVGNKPIVTWTVKFLSEDFFNFNTFRYINCISIILDRKIYDKVRTNSFTKEPSVGGIFNCINISIDIVLEACSILSGLPTNIVYEKIQQKTKELKNITIERKNINY